MLRSRWFIVALFATVPLLAGLAWFSAWFPEWGQRVQWSLVAFVGAFCLFAAARIYEKRDRGGPECGRCGTRLDRFDVTFCPGCGVHPPREA